MKKQRNKFLSASALQITLSVTLISISAILLASSFNAAQLLAPQKASQRSGTDTGRLFAKLSPDLLRPEQPRQLSLADRVAYQYAIEEVYWRHRIWPKENPGPKPSLDAVMSAAQIEKKVEDYLRNSQLLADQWQRPITPEQLQAEVERMASQTKQPEVLREIFAALGNDPFVVAECLARPILVERLVSEWQEPLRSGVAKAQTQEPVSMAAVSANYTLPEISSPSDVCTNDTWTPTSLTNTPAARALHTAVWTGSEMIVWGGGTASGNYLKTGGRYNPSTDSWVATSTAGAPAARVSHTAVWTGSQMIVWGGQTTSGSNFNTGGRYNPGTNSWTATSTASTPTARSYHTAVWTGTEMIVWGGFSNSTNLNTGGRYNPGTNSWIATSTTGAPAERSYHTAVWTGTEMIVWGGPGPISGTGGRYDPGTNSWTDTSLTGAPAERYQHTAVWTGTEMIVWGGYPDTNTGGRYSPGTNSWTATSTTNAPVGRSIHTAVWTGSEMIVWGGRINFSSYLNTGGRYNPSSDSWTATSTTNAPDARENHTAVWTGSEMIVWGGYPYTNPGGRYCVQPFTPSPTPTPTPTPPVNVTITKTSDHPGIFIPGAQIGFRVVLNNSSPTDAVGLIVNDSLPHHNGVNWTIDSANTDFGWSVTGAPPTQNLVYNQTTLPGNTMTRAHVVSATTLAACNAILDNTASFTSSNAGSGQATAREASRCAPTPTTTPTPTPTPRPTPTPTPTPLPSPTPPRCTPITSCITGGFNGTSIPTNRYIWFSGNMKASNIPATGATIYFTNSMITVTSRNGTFNYTTRDGIIVFDPNATCATTTFDGTQWVTTVPLSGSDEVLVSALGIQPTVDLKGAKVKWCANFSADTNNLKVSWKAGAAVYTSDMTEPNYNALGVKPTHTNACLYNNSDHAGTPENMKQFLVGGAGGGGGSNYTGSWGSTSGLNVCPP